MPFHGVDCGAVRGSASVCTAISMSCCVETAGPLSRKHALRIVHFSQGTV
jgi:hypothetical protein